MIKVYLFLVILLTAKLALAGNTRVITGDILQSSDLVSQYTINYSALNNVGAGTTLQYTRGDGTLATLNTANVPELTNLYFTNARAQGAVSATAPIVDTGGVFSCVTATGLVAGCLAAADFTTFASSFHLPALTAGSVLFSDGSTIAQNNADLFWDNTNTGLKIAHTGASGAYALTINDTDSQGGNIHAIDFDGVSFGGATIARTDGGASASFVEIDGAADAAHGASIQLGGNNSNSGSALITPGTPAGGFYVFDSTQSLFLFGTSNDVLLAGVPFQMTQSVTPTALPGASGDNLYFKADNKLYAQDSTGTEKLIGPLATGITSQYIRGNGSLATLDTSVVPENGNLYFTNARAIAAPITGYVSGAGVVSAVDSVLQAIQKLNGNIAASVGAAITSLTGDGTATGPGAAALTLATVNGSPGSFGSASNTLTATVNGKGLVTAMAATPIVIAESQVTNLVSDLAGKEPTITAGTTAQYWRGDKTFQTLDTSVVPENGNLYYTQARFDTAFAAKSTTNLAEGTNLYFTNARAIAAPITGYVSGAGTVAATDSILQAINKLNGNTAAVSGSAITSLTSDVVATGPGAAAATIQPGVVTLAKMANVAAHSYIGNNTASSAVPLALTNTQLTADLIPFVGDAGTGGTQGLVPAPAAVSAEQNGVLGAGGSFIVNDLQKPNNPPFQYLTQSLAASGNQKMLNAFMIQNNGNTYAIGGGGTAKTITIYNVTNQANPQIRGSLNISGTYGVCGSNASWPYIFVPSQGARTLVVVNIANPNNPVITATYTWAANTTSVYSCAYYNGLVFMAGQNHGLGILDVGNGVVGGTISTPVLAFDEGTLNGAGQICNVTNSCKSFGVAVDGANSIAYVTAFSTATPWTYRQLKAYSFASSITSPTLLQNLTLPANTKALSVVLNLGTKTAFVTDTNQTLIDVVDLTNVSTGGMTNLSTMAVTGGRNFNSQSAAIVAQGSNFVYIPSGGNALTGAIDMYDVTNRSAPSYVNTVLAPGATTLFGSGSIDPRGGYIYVGDYGTGSSGSALDIFSMPFETATAGALTTSSASIKGFTTAGVVHNSSAGLLSSSLVSLTADVSGALPNANIANTSITVNGTSCTLGGSCSPSGAGGITAISVASANGLAGTSSGGTTPALTLSTSVTGLVKGNGTAFSAAASGTDYQAPISSTTPVSHQFLTSFTAPNTFAQAQPAFTDISGQATNAQLANPATTVNGQTCTLGSTCTISVGSGTVTSVAATVPSVLSISGSPITTSGTLAISYSGTALPIANGGTNSTAALNNNRVMQSSGGAIVEAAAITASRALISDAGGIPTQSATTSTELGYVSGVTSAIQTQLNAKQASFTWTQEAPSGTVNNSNTAFTLAHTPVSNGSMKLFLDGLILVQGTNYTLAGTAITMTTAPNFNQSLYADYAF